MFRKLWHQIVGPIGQDDGKQLLMALLAGETLKSHRNLDGDKQYLLHNLDGTTRPIDPYTVNQLCKKRLIGSNQKFPAATYILTELGRKLAEESSSVKDKPITARLR